MALELATRYPEKVGALVLVNPVGLHLDGAPIEEMFGRPPDELAEMLFVDYPAGKRRIVDYAAKWHSGSFEFCNTVRRFEFDETDRPLLAQLEDIARTCWRLFGLRGYARVDCRVDTAGRPWVLEVNVNPCLSPDAGFAAAVERRGRACRPCNAGRVRP